MVDKSAAWKLERDRSGKLVKGNNALAGVGFAVKMGRDNDASWGSVRILGGNTTQLEITVRLSIVKGTAGFTAISKGMDIQCEIDLAGADEVYAVTGSLNGHKTSGVLFPHLRKSTVNLSPTKLAPGGRA